MTPEPAAASNAAVPCQGTTEGIIDCAVHPVPQGLEVLREYLREPWRSRLRSTGPKLYRPRFPEHLPDYVAATRPGSDSDPATVTRRAVLRGDVRYAILVPLTWGRLADPEFGSAIASAVNSWLADTWLTRHNADGRFKGSIRVCPTDPRAAVREIERWAGHPHFVQVVVSLTAQSPYGDPAYFPIWEAASRHQLPVAVHAEDGIGGGIDPPPTFVGFPPSFAEYYAMLPFNATLHLTSLICQGVFNRLESLVFVFADGAANGFRPLLWRLDKHWQALRYEVPWVDRRPTSYISRHARFITHRADGPADPQQCADALRILGGTTSVMYGSRYPKWDHVTVDSVDVGLSPDERRKLLFENAQLLYRLP